MNETGKRFMRAIDQLEEQIDKGFFLSFINKIVVDEKKIFTIINELRSLVSEQFAQDSAYTGSAYSPPGETPEEADEPVSGFVSNSAPAPRGGTQLRSGAEDLLDQARSEAESMRRGAGTYADNVLSELEERLNNALASVRQGRKVIEERSRMSGGETHGSSEI